MRGCVLTRKMAVGGYGTDSELWRTDNEIREGMKLTKPALGTVHTGLNAEQQCGTVVDCVTGHGQTRAEKLHGGSGIAGGASSDAELTTMARRPESAAHLLGSPCAAADRQPQVLVPLSHPPALQPVAFINGFQKRLGVYKSKIVCHLQDNHVASEDSESDISSLEIDSNLSDSSVLSNPASSKSSFLPPIDENNLDGNSASAGDGAYSNFTLSDREDSEFDLAQESAGHLPFLGEVTDDDSSPKQTDFGLGSIGQDEHTTVNSSLTGTRLSPERISPSTATAEKPPDTQPLVLKIRRRTWANSETTAGDIKRPRSDGRGRFKSASESLDCHQTVKVEWQSVVGTHSPETEKEDIVAMEQIRTESSSLSESTVDQPKRKHRRHHHKSSKPKTSRHDCVLHRNGSHLKDREHSHSRHSSKSHRKKCKRNASKNRHLRSENDYSHTEKTLQLPSDPQKAVRVLEKALESINAQIKRLKRETELDEKRTNKPKSRRKKKGSKKDRKRLNGETKRRQKKDFPTSQALPTVSHFKLSDLFPVVPSLIVRNNDLHPAYRSSVDPGQPPVAGHPIWRWRIGQPPLPRT